MRSAWRPWPLAIRRTGPGGQERRGVGLEGAAEVCDEVVWRQPAKPPLIALSIERIYLGGSLAEIGLGPQRGCSAGLLPLILIFRIEKISDALIGIFVEGLRIEKSGIGRSDGERQVIINGVKKNEIAEHVPFDRQQEDMAAALQAFEQVGPAKAHQALASTRQVVQDLCLGIGGWRGRRWLDVIAQTVAREFQAVYGLNDVVCEQPSVLLVYIKPKRLWDSRWEIGARAVFKGQIFSPIGLVCGSIVVLDELRVRRTRYRRISSRQSSAYSDLSKAAKERTGA